jgi:osmotically-inducible protein OsmY
VVNSFNRRVLIVGTVPTQTDKALVARVVEQVENVKEIVDELGVMGEPSLNVRSSDTIITTRVKASFIDARDLSANAISVTTERGVVYMMGRVTQREANRAADIVARTVPGVQQVVRVFEFISEEELARIQPPR